MDGALPEQQDAFQLLANESIDGVVISDTAGLIWFANPAFRRMSGFGDRAIGSRIPDYHSPENLPRVSSEVLPALMSEGRWQGELVHTRPDGTGWLAQLSAVVLSGPKGEASGIGTIFRDVTEQRRREQELSELYQRVEQSFATSPLATIEAGRDGALTRWNPAAERVFGWSPAEVLGKNVFEILMPNQAPEEVQALVGMLMSGTATNFRIANRTKDGHTITCQWHIAVMRGAQDEVVSWMAQTEDITEQLRSIEALRKSEAWNRALLESIPDLMFLFDADGRYLDIRVPAGTELLSEPEEFLNKLVAEVLPSDVAAVILGAIRRALESKVAVQFEYSLMLRSGLKTYEGRAAAVSDQQVMMLARNITDRVRAEKERNALQEQIIATQQDALRELGTPIIPISEGVVAMPLIGSLDGVRAQQVIETLLEGVTLRRAEIAILDITGVRVVDTAVAQALLRAAQAVRMLGTQMILTGITPEVAQTLVGLGLDLRGIITLATLQSGITYALGRNHR